jgi:hypothetical protein
MCRRFLAQFNSRKRDCTVPTLVVDGMEALGIMPERGILSKCPSIPHVVLRPRKWKSLLLIFVHRNYKIGRHEEKEIFLLLSVDVHFMTIVLPKSSAIATVYY